jgi:tRNA pseudouridine38-40 synthase
VSIRLRVDLGYHGGQFSGWAIQPGLRTIQGALEQALAVALRIPPEQTRVVVAGRTDAGVHALAQVCHLDLPEGYELSPHALHQLPKRVQGALATNAIVIHGISQAPEGFDARFSALSREYRYRIADGLSLKNPLHADFTLWNSYALDLEAMDTVASALLGLHDWASFCRPRVGATTIRELQHYRWVRDEDGVLVGRVIADAFCHSMVRALVGAAVAVGRGKLTLEGVLGLRDAARRTSEFATMPAHGLTLISIAYPKDTELAERARLTRNKRDADPD